MSTAFEQLKQKAQGNTIPPAPTATPTGTPLQATAMPQAPTSAFEALKQKASVTQVPQTQAPEKPRSVLGKVGNFLAPTLTKTISKAREGEKVGLRDVAGSALEVGSYLVPAGAVAKGLGLAGKTAKTMSMANKVKLGAGIGAVSGGMAGAGRSVGEGGGVGDVARETAMGGAFGAVAGAAIPPLASGIGKAYKGVTMPKQQRVEKAVNELEDKYLDINRGWVQTRKASEKASRVTQIKNKSGTVGRTPERVLSENGIIPEHKGTEFTTTAQAEKLKEKARPLIELNRNALREAQRSVPKVSFDELEAAAIARARSPKNVAAGDAESLVAGIRRDMAVYRSSFGDSVNLETLDDIKSARWERTGFSLTRDDKLASDIDYLIGKTAQETIEDYAARAGHTDVAQLNREIGDIFEASKFLKNLDGKKVLYGKFGTHMTRLAGTVIGSQGGAIGSIAGWVGGDLVANMLRSTSIATPVKRMILKDLEKRDSEAYKKTLEWLQKQGLDRELRLKLPQGNTMFMGPETKNYQSSVRIVPAAKGEPGRDVKTGKFFRTYSSQPQGNLPSTTKDIPTQTTNAKTSASMGSTVAKRSAKVKRPKGNGLAFRTAPKNTAKQKQAGFGKTGTIATVGAGFGAVSAYKKLEGMTPPAASFERKEEPKKAEPKPQYKTVEKPFIGTNYDPLDPNQTRPNPNGEGAVTGVKLDESMVATPRKTDGVTAMLRLGTVIYIPELDKKFLVADLMNERFNGMHKIDFVDRGSKKKPNPTYNKNFTIQIVREGNGYDDARQYVLSGEWEREKNRKP